MNPEKKPLFTFAVISDSHIKPHEGDLSSPFPTNLLANSRNRYAVQMINHLNPQFAIHLGDLTQPVPALPTHGKAAQAVLDIFSDLNCRMHYTPGNHDIGDKPVDWMPAHKCSEEWTAEFERYFGKAYSSFDFQDCHFVLLNTSLLNSGLPSESAQQAWLEHDLAENQGKRIFMFMHYPPFLTKPDEDTHYENLDEPARSWLLYLIAKHSVEAVFSGHVHGFFYNQYAGTEVYVAPSVTFIRNDFSELFRVPPESEHGRNDLGKFGILLVKVFADGHVADFIHTNGATLDPGETIVDGSYYATLRDAGFHPKEGKGSVIGVDMRHPWAEVVEMPFNSPVDEFNRKKVRNDYPLLALWDCGISKVRIPASDLLQDETRSRMRDLKRIGHQFTVFSFGKPSGRLREAIVAHNDLVDVWEVVAPWEQFAEIGKDILAIKEQTGVRTQIARVASSAHGEIKDSSFDMFVFHGFHASQEGLLKEFLAGGGREVADQFVFQVPSGSAPWEEIKAIDQLAGRLGVRASVTVQLAPENEAWAMFDDRAQANRVAESVLAALLSDKIDLFFDTFDDLDRGYFARHGLVDRRFNLRPAGHALRSLHGLYRSVLDGIAAESSNITEDAISRTIALSGPGGEAMLLLPQRAAESLQEISVPRELPASGVAQVVDLVTEQLHQVNWHLNESKGKAFLAEAVEFGGPLLVRL